MVVNFRFRLQGVNLEKLMAAGRFICSALCKKTGSKVSQALGCGTASSEGARWQMYSPYQLLPICEYRPELRVT